MRHDIEFKAGDGTLLRGWHYVPDGAKGRVPTIVMCHGFSAVKEMYLDRYAELFAAAGLAALVYDNRGFGASDGTPRLEIDPWQQVRDWRDALTFAETLPATDATRLGVWGSSYSGGHAIVVGALDRRVKCVVSQVPLTDGLQTAQRLISPDKLPGIRAMFDADRRARLAGQPPAMMPVVAQDGPSALPTPDSWEWMTQTAEQRAPSWRNEVTLRTLEMLSEYAPGEYVARVSPTPLLMLVAREDYLCLPDVQLAAYERALQPKQLKILDGGHFDAYTKGFEASGPAARDWFVTHLLNA